MVRQLAHEIKNPLGGLRGAAQLLERELLDPALREYTRIIISEADRLTHLLDSMLGPGRPPAKQLVNVHELLERVYHLLRSEAPEGVTVDRDYDPSLPALTVDPNHIIQAMLNLGRNAIQALSGSARMSGAASAAVDPAHARRDQREHRRAPPPSGGLHSIRGQRPRGAAGNSRHDFLSARVGARRRHGPGAGDCAGSGEPARRPHRVRQRARSNDIRDFSAHGFRMNAKPLQVWLVDDDASIRWVLEKALKGSGMTARCFDQADNVLTALRADAPDVLMTDIRMPGRSGLDLLKEIQVSRPGLPVIVMTAHSDLDAAVAAYQGGAFEYLPKPFDIDKAVDLVRRAAQQATVSTDVEAARRSIPELLGQAAAMQQVFRAVGRLSRSSMTVLITGESGTGKELVARALHRHSPRSSKAFVALNTAAFTADLLESELFGHEKGAFTGADTLRRGRFEQADGGTLFLDEIGDMSPALQTRLLRVLAEGEFYRVGGQTPVKVDVRVIAATHQDLEARVKSGHFREDLLHRLNVIRIEIPPLRERREDIPELLRHYLSVAGQELGVEPKLLTTPAETALVTFDWPGNVRQLVNACRRLTVTAPGREIRAEDIPPDLGGASTGHAANHDWMAKLSHWAEQELDAGTQRLLDQAVPEVERILIRVALRKADGLKQDAAKLLGLGPQHAVAQDEGARHGGRQLIPPRTAAYNRADHG